MLLQRKCITNTYFSSTKLSRKIAQNATYNCQMLIEIIKILRYHRLLTYPQSGRIGKVVAMHAAVARSIPAEVALIYTMHEAVRGYCP